MKELQGESASEKLLQVHHQHQERSHLHQHLVSSGVTSPNYGPLTSILNPSALFGADMAGSAMLSAHILASLTASNAGGRFQIPLSLPIPVSSPQLYPHHHHQPGNPHGHPPASAAQLELLSSWVKEQASKDSDRKIGGNKIKSKGGGVRVGVKQDPHNWPMSKAANKKGGGGGGGGGGAKNGKVAEKNLVNLVRSHHHHKMMEDPADFVIHPPKVSPNQNLNNNVNPKGKKDKSGGVGGGKETSHIGNNNNNVNESNGQSLSNQNKDKVFICPICSRCFGYKHVLQNHERTHTGEKPFECTICHKKFTRDHHLKTHMRLHTGEKPYQCTHCERQFVQVANLRRHLRVHTGERPYACDLCSSRFSDSNQLKAHNLIHKGEKPYGCEDCGGRFRRRHHLAHHKCKDVQGLPPFEVEEEEEEEEEEKDIVSPSPPSREKHERKPRETRRILRFHGDPATITSPTPIQPHTLHHSFMGVMGVPEQTVPEDLSLTGNGRTRHFSGSCSASASPSPHSGGSNSSSLGGGLYCRSLASSDPQDFSSDEETRCMSRRHHTHHHHRVSVKTDTSPMDV